MNHQPVIKTGRPTKRGLFTNGIWQCDCDPRMPAEKFQTKNGGKNHGRWFFTCQKPQPKRCSFFLWADQAKVREEAAVLNNSKSEPQTPQKPVAPVQPPTPQSRPKVQLSPSKRTPIVIELDDDNDEDDFGWSSSADEAMAKIPIEETDLPSPRKSARTTLFTSPSRRSHQDDLQNSLGHDSNSSGTVRAGDDDDIFITPTRPRGLLSPIVTPVHHPHPQPNTDINTIRSDPPTSAAETSPGERSLVTAALSILSPHKVPPSAIGELTALLTRHEQRTIGIAKGRDISRIAIQAKEKTIVDLQTRISSLEAEKETSRLVIAHLKQDIATSPKKPKRGGGAVGGGGFSR